VESRRVVLSDEDPAVHDDDRREATREEATREEDTREEVVAQREDTDVQPEADADTEDRAGQEAGSALIDQRIEDVKRKAEEMAEREKA
jgi:hypothetical protein